MPTIQINGATLYYEDSHPGDQDLGSRERETVVFAHGLLWSGRMFDAQAKLLRERYRVITFDFRGQGKSEVTTGGYDMDTLAEDAAALIEALDVAPCHFAGLSMGGFIGMRLAARRPDLIRSLMLLETSAEPEPRENVPRYRMLNFIARWLGLGIVSRQVMPIMFGRKFLDDPARAEEREHWRKTLASNHRLGITRAVRGVIERQGVEDELERIKAPTLVVVGDQDVATVPAKSERIAARIAGSRLVVIPGAGHSSTIEEPAAVGRAIEEFLATIA